MTEGVCVKERKRERERTDRIWKRMPKRHGPLDPLREEDIKKPSTERRSQLPRCVVSGLELLEWVLANPLKEILGPWPIHDLLENTPGRNTCQMCPWLISTSSGRCICRGRRDRLCVSHGGWRKDGIFGLVWCLQLERNIPPLQLGPSWIVVLFFF